MRWPPAPLRRPARGTVVLAAILAPSAITLWVSSPDPSDIGQRVRTVTQARGVPLLGADDVPPLLAEAVVAIEDERFYSHHGIDSIGLGRAILYDVTNRLPVPGWVDDHRAARQGPVPRRLGP